MNYEINENYYTWLMEARNLSQGQHHVRIYDGHYTITVDCPKLQKKLIFWKPASEEPKVDKVRADSYYLAGEFHKLTAKKEFADLTSITPGRLIRLWAKYILKLSLNQKKLKIYGDKYCYLARTRPQLKLIKHKSFPLSEVDCFSQADLELVKGRLSLDRQFSKEELILNLDSLYGFTKIIKEDHSHWHYLYLADNPSGYVIELDIKSAYLTSLLKEKTLFWYDTGREKSPYYMPDGGLIKRLKTWQSDLPKWFRLQLLGIWASHSSGFSYLDAENPMPKEAQDLIISHGVVFNVTHKAILGVYKDVAAIAKVCGKALVRSHTDSVAVRVTTLANPQEDAMTVEQVDDLVEDINRMGYLVSCKGFGYAHFFDNEKGFIGNKPYIGQSDQIKDLIKETGKHPYIPAATPQLYSEFRHWFRGEPPMPANGYLDYRYNKLEEGKFYQLPGSWWFCGSKVKKWEVLNAKMDTY